jgi:hypothetical protein
MGFLGLESIFKVYFNILFELAASNCNKWFLNMFFQQKFISNLTVVLKKTEIFKNI